MERKPESQANTERCSGSIDPARPVVEPGRPRVGGQHTAGPGSRRDDAPLSSIIAMDADWHIRFWGERAEALFGWAPAEALGRKASELLDTPDELPDARAALAHDGFWRGMLTRRRRDGTRSHAASTWVLQRDPLDGTSLGVIAVLNTIPAQSLSGATLNRSEQRLRLAQEAAGVGTWEWDIRADLVTGTAMVFEQWGIPAPSGPLSVAEFRARVHPGDLAGLNHAISHALETGTRYQREFRIIRSDGEERWLSAHGDVVRSETGEPVTMLGATVDITGRIAAAKALEEREAYLRAVLETVPSAMAVIDEHGLLQSFSATAERMFGYTADEVFGTNVSRLMPEPDRSAHDRYLERYVATGERHIIGSSRIVTGLRKGGEQFPLELWVGEVHGTDRRLFTGFMRDVTERNATETRLRELQAELQHVSRLSAMGEMASALAHELNQPLTAIANFVHAAQRMLATSGEPTPGEASAALQRAAEQALRAGQIIRRVRDFVARGETEQRAEPVVRLIEEAVALALLGAQEAGVQVRLRLAPDLPPVLADRVQIQQVLVNLIRNAAEAMAGVRTPDPDARELIVDASGSAGRFVEISVADRGPGLAEEVVHNLFRPFVTTKPHGMGVGLSVSRSIVEAHGGRLWVEPRPGGGTVFRFTLPVAA